MQIYFDKMIIASNKKSQTRKIKTQINIQVKLIRRDRLKMEFIPYKCNIQFIQLMRNRLFLKEYNK